MVIDFHIHAFPDAVAETAVGLMIKPLGMLTRQDGVRRSVVIYDVDNALHAIRVNVIDQALEVFHCTEFGIDRAII